MDVSLFRQLRQAAMLLASEFRVAGSEDDPLKSLLRDKMIYELGYNEGPVPDGLSEAYIVLSAARNAEAKRLDAGNQHAAPLTRALANAVNHEIATARVLELRLLKLLEKAPCE